MQSHAELLTVEFVCKVKPTASAEVTSRCTAAETLLGFSTIKLLAATLSMNPITCMDKLWPVLYGM